MLRPELSRSLLVAPLAALAIALTPVAASAGEPAAQQKIRISDFDLNKHEDVVRLYRHIIAAAIAACGGETRTGSLLPSSGQQACVQKAIDNTVAKIHNEQLTAYQQKATGDQKLAEQSGWGGKRSKSDADHN
jgi:UrcA family protein